MLWYFLVFLVVHPANGQAILSSKDDVKLEQNILENIRKPLLQLMIYYQERTLDECQKICSKKLQSYEEAYERLYEEIKKLNTTVISLKEKGVKRCPNEWMEYSNRCYKIEETPANFTEAKAKCSTYGSELAIPSNEDENSFIAGLVSRIPVTDKRIWIGVIAGGSPDVYVNAYSLRPIIYNNWHRDEPNRGDQKCVLMNYMEVGFWDDDCCSAERKYICQQPL